MIPFLSPSKVWRYRNTISNTEEIKRRDLIDRRKRSGSRTTRRSKPHFEDCHSHARPTSHPSTTANRSTPSRARSLQSRPEQKKLTKLLPSALYKDDTHSSALFDVLRRHFPSCVVRRHERLYQTSMETALLLHSSASHMDLIRQLLAEESQEERLRKDIEVEAHKTRLHLLVSAFQTLRKERPAEASGTTEHRALASSALERKAKEPVANPVASSSCVKQPIWHDKIHKRRQHATVQTRTVEYSGSGPHFSCGLDDIDEKSLPKYLHGRTHSQRKEILLQEITSLMGRMARFSLQVDEPMRQQLRESQERLLLAQLAHEEAQRQLDVVLGDFAPGSG